MLAHVSSVLRPMRVSELFHHYAPHEVIRWEATLTANCHYAKSLETVLEGWQSFSGPN
ncbi:hypothetical protein KIN20_028113, partial [Parelaphostrongylus tenuis]